MTTYTQDNRRMGVMTALGKDALLLSRFEGTETISGLFSFDVQLLSTNDLIRAESMVGSPLVFWVLHPDNEPRYFNGYVKQFEYVGRGDRLSLYRANIVPWLWFTSLNSDCRIFQEMTVPQIIRQVFERRGFTDFEDSFVRASYPTLEYCVQYNESDFAFVSRLMEEWGISYFFRHEESRHVMVMTDTAMACGVCKDATINFTDKLSERSYCNEVWEWKHRYEYRAGRWAHRDYNFESPSNDLFAFSDTVLNLPNNKALEVYEYPGRYTLRDDGNAFTKVRIEAEESRYDTVNGRGCCRSFSPGARFAMEKHHSQRETGKSYIVTSSRHYLEAASQYTTGGTGPSQGYENEFTCIPAEAPLRPMRATPRPRVPGPQTAMVVGPAGEEIYTDEHGRVKVQFHWDREGQRNENSSCWMRVSQVHAGQGWGMMDLPRIGEEVIVSFLEGDPDRPIITGRVYNGQNRPPFSLPAEKTRRGNSTKTYKGGGYNEMSMDDTPGKEQLRMNAQYDMNSNVNHDQTLDVGNNQTEKVAVDRTREVGNNEKVTVGVNKDVNVGTNHNETIGVSQSISVGSSQSTSVGSTQSNSVGSMKNETVGMMSNEMVGIAKTLNVGAAYSIISGGMMNTAVGIMSTEQVGSTKKVTVGSKLEITCGSSKLTMESGGKVTISGTEFNFSASGPVKINGAIIDLN
ncbi:MAG: type VI secretion system tip protein TssI/VgrG [Planctomycetaceae bacterium]